MLDKTLAKWRARGHYRRFLSPLSMRERGLWLQSVANAARRGAPTMRPDEVAIHSRAAYETIHSRPKEASLARVSLVRGHWPRTGIVVQGPLVPLSDFTLEAVNAYRNLFSDSPVIVVTWDDESSHLLGRLQSTGAVVHAIPKPGDAGPANINLQRTAVSAGLQVASDLGCDFVVRTRSDQRIYDDQALSFLHGALSAFRPPSQPGIKRIVASSLDTFRFRLYGLSDQFQFGTTQDLMTYWSAPEVDDLEASPLDAAAEARASAAERIAIPEVALTTRYLARTNWQVKWTLADWWAALADRFVILDASSLDLLWVKYTRSEFRWRRYGKPSPLEELDFADWLTLYSFADRNNGDTWDSLLNRTDWVD